MHFFYQTSPGRKVSHYFNPRESYFIAKPVCFFIWKFVCNPSLPYLLYSSVPLSLPQVPPHAAGTTLWGFKPPTQPSVIHIQVPCMPAQWGVYVHDSDLGIVPAANQLLVHSAESVCLWVHCYPPMCVAIQSVCVPTCASASCCRRKSFEPFKEKPSGTGLERL